MIALIGTAKPSAEELLSQGPGPVETTLSRYGKVSIGKESSSSTIIEGLRAQTPYVVYAIAEDRAGLLSEIKNIEFSSGGSQ